MWQKVDSYYFKNKEFTISLYGQAALDPHGENSESFAIVAGADRSYNFALWESNNLIKHFETFEEAAGHHLEILSERQAAITAKLNEQMPVAA